MFTAAMLDTRGFVYLLSLLDLICFNDLFYLYVLDWSRTFCHVLFDVTMTQNWCRFIKLSFKIVLSCSMDFYGRGWRNYGDWFVSIMFYAVLFPWFQIVSKALVMLSGYHEEEKIHVFKELDSPALSLWFSLQSSREEEQRRLYNILSCSVILFSTPPSWFSSIG